MRYFTEEEEKVIKEFVSRLKKELGENLLLVKLFGSKLRGDFSPDSDIDILLVVKTKNLELRNKIYDLLFEIDPYWDCKISLKIFSEYEYQKNIELESPFILNLEREGVTL